MSKNIFLLPRTEMHVDQLNGLSIAMGRCNFVVILDLWGFELLKPQTFTLELLSELIVQSSLYDATQKPRVQDWPMVAGSLQPVNFKDVQDGVDDILFWSSGSWNRKDPLAQSIRNIYWDIVLKCLVIPPTHFFVHTPAPGSYFDDIGYNFCFVLIGENTGVVLSGLGAA